MFLVGLISWWYGRGWTDQWARTTQRFSTTLDFFSIGQLVSTLFSPFRQISASNGSDGTFGGAFRAFIDKSISRIIGSIIRFFTILFGLVVIIFQALYSFIILFAWWFVPLLPVAGAILFAVGWVPLWT